MHFFIGRIWDGGLKGLPVCLIFWKIPSVEQSVTELGTVMFGGKACLRSSCLSWCATCSPAQCPIRPQITHFFNESHNSWYWAISGSLSSPSFQQTEHFTKYGCFHFECLAYSSTMRLSMMWRWWRQWPTAANGNPHPSQYQQYQWHTITITITILVDTFDALYNSDFHDQHDNDGNTFQMFRGGSVAITKLQRYTRWWCASIWLNGHQIVRTQMWHFEGGRFIWNTDLH